MTYGMDIPEGSQHAKSNIGIKIDYPPRRYRAIELGQPNPVFLRDIGRLRYWWGKDIWIGRFPLLKTEAAIFAVGELARWLR
jgi:hypothetical protein